MRHPGQTCNEAEGEIDQLRADLAAAQATIATLQEARTADLEAIVAAQAQLAAVRGSILRALAYLNDREDVESTPLHAIGHARTELQAALLRAGGGA